MITHTEIKLGEYLGTFELFEQLIDVGKWVFVLDGLLVHWTVINTKSVRSILLLHKKNTTTPRRRTRPDEPFFLEYRVASSAPSTLQVRACKDVCTQVPYEAQDQ